MTTLSELEGKVWVGDCLPVMRAWPDDAVDLVWCDPPYNRGKAYGVHNDAMPLPLYLEWAEERVVQMVRVARRGVALFLPQYLVLHYWRWLPTAEQIIIPKGAFGARSRGGMWRQQYHVVLTTGQPIAADHASNVWKGIRLPGEGYYFHEERPAHPGFTCRALTGRAIETLTLPGELVFDPFMGSGTTGVECERLERRWIGCESNTEFALLAEARIAKARAQVKLFPAGVAQ